MAPDDKLFWIKLLQAALVDYPAYIRGSEHDDGQYRAPDQPSSRCFEFGANQNALIEALGDRRIPTAAVVAGTLLSE